MVEEITRQFAVFDMGEIVYQSNKLGEGIAFIQGRGSGQLVGRLTDPHVPNPPLPAKPKRPAKRKVVKP